MRDLVFFLTSWLPEAVQTLTVWVMLKIVAIIAAPDGLLLPISRFAERKIIGYMQTARRPQPRGPERVGCNRLLTRSNC